MCYVLSGFDSRRPRLKKFFYGLGIIVLGYSRQFGAFSRPC